MKLECKIHSETFESGIDYNAHNLFYHGVMTNKSFTSDKIKQSLQKKYDSACEKLTILCDKSNQAGKEWREYSDKINKNRKTGYISEPIKTNKKSEKLLQICYKVSNEWQKQVYAVNSIVREIESYGLQEKDFE